MNTLKEKWIELARQHHFLLIILISLTLFSLLGIQAYWIHVELSLQEDRLNDQMQDVLLDMHHMIENDSLLSQQLIDYFSGYENTLAPSVASASGIRRETQSMMDSVLRAHQLASLDYDFAFYHTQKEEIIISSETSTHTLTLADYAEYSERAGARVRRALGQGMYRFGIFFNNKFWYLLQQAAWLLGLSLVLSIVLMGSFMSTLLVLDKQRRITRMHNDFINNLAHELKTPVFASSVIFKIIQKHLQMRNYEKLDEPLQLLEQENNLLKDKIEKVLDLSIFEEGLPALQMEPVNIHQLIDKTVATYRYQAEGRGGSLLQDFQSASSGILGDARHLHNLLQNLLDNALKYSPGVPSVRISTRQRGEKILLSIEDRGIGMSEEEQFHVFDKFYRASNGNAHDTKGFGLGLSYVRKITELHGGQIEVKSNKGKGSRFIITFPLIPEHKLSKQYAWRS